MPRICCQQLPGVPLSQRRHKSTVAAVMPSVTHVAWRQLAELVQAMSGSARPLTSYNVLAVTSWQAHSIASCRQPSAAESGHQSTRYCACFAAVIGVIIESLSAMHSAGCQATGKFFLS